MRRRQATPEDRTFLLVLPAEKMERLELAAGARRMTLRLLMEEIVDEWLAARVAALEGRED